MQTIILEKNDGLAKIIFNRPEVRNAFSRPMWLELLEIVREIKNDDNVKCVVLTGAGDAFSAGGDVKDMLSNLEGEQPSADERAQFIRQVVDSAVMLHEMPKPTIAAINGAVAGAGLSLALACDIRLMVAEAKLTTAFLNVALSGDFGGAWFLTRLVGPAVARQMFFLPEAITGVEAEKIGLVNFALPKPAFDEKLEEICGRLMRSPSKTLAFMKQNFLAAQNMHLADYLNQEAIFMGLSFGLDDHKEAASAFVEKRVPKFTGK